MYLILNIFITLLTITNVNAKPIKIAVMDSGINSYYKFLHEKTCEFENFTNSVEDDLKHGTNVTGLIFNELKDAKIDYCFVVIKIFPTNDAAESIYKALEFVSNSKDIDYLNLSLGGYGNLIREGKLLEKIANNGVKIIAAAGNNSHNLDESCNFFPACYDKVTGIYIIGNGFSLDNRSKTSNYGSRVTAWVDGQQKCFYDICMSGTSQATAIFTGQLVKQHKGKK
jgi:subtilisin family serine protease